MQFRIDLSVGRWLCTVLSIVSSVCWYWIGV